MAAVDTMAGHRTFKEVGCQVENPGE